MDGATTTCGIADGEHLPAWPPLVGVASCAAPATIAYALRSGHVPEALIVPTVVALGAAALIASALLLCTALYMTVATGMSLVRSADRRRESGGDEVRASDASGRVPEGHARGDAHRDNVVPFILKERDSRITR